jgi:hypothetical protein
MNDDDWAALAEHRASDFDVVYEYGFAAFFHVGLLDGGPLGSVEEGTLNPELGFKVKR